MLSDALDTPNRQLITEGVLLAAEYVRMSTEHQRYSIGYQRAAIAEYASRRGFAIVESYADEGKSGVTIKHRVGLQRLLADVVAGQVRYQVVLVYDVSRWGRFIDADEAAHYEFLCRQAGVTVRYVAELFEDDGSPLSSMVKGFKRAMASEFSRELSTKVSLVHAHGARDGHWQGGRAPLGMSRMMLDEAGIPKQILLPGQRKNLRSERVKLVAGPPDEVALVRRIFKMFVKKRLGPTAIAARLNADGIPTIEGNLWIHSTVKLVLTNSIYVGIYTYRKLAQILGGPTVRRPPSEWIVREDSFEPIVDRHLFDRAQAIFQKQSDGLTEADLLRLIRKAASVDGTVNSRKLAAATPHGWKSLYERTFGGLPQAYAAAGVPAIKDFSFIGNMKRSRRMNRALFAELRLSLGEAGLAFSCKPKQSRATLADGRMIAVVATGPKPNVKYPTLVWSLHLKLVEPASILLLACGGAAPEDDVHYFVVPIAQVHRRYMVMPSGDPTKYRHFLECDRDAALSKIVDLARASSDAREHLRVGFESDPD